MAGRRGLVPGRPFGRVISDWLIKHDKDNDTITSFDQLAAEMKMDPSNLRKIRDGKRSWIGFDVADKIVVVCLGAGGWRDDSELSHIYQSTDFTWLDMKKPCAVAA